MSSELQVALVAALVGGGLVMLDAVLQHFLSLREDRIRRERDREAVQAKELRDGLTSTSLSGEKTKICPGYQQEHPYDAKVLFLLWKGTIGWPYRSWSKEIAQ